MNRRLLIIGIVLLLLLGFGVLNQYTGMIVYTGEPVVENKVMSLELTKDYSENAYFLLNVNGKDYKKNYNELFSEKLNTLEVNVDSFTYLESGEYQAILSLIDNGTLIGLSVDKIVIVNEDYITGIVLQNESEINEQIENQTELNEQNNEIITLQEAFLERNLQERNETIVEQNISAINETNISEINTTLNDVNVTLQNESNLTIEINNTFTLHNTTERSLKKIRVGENVTLIRKISLNETQDNLTIQIPGNAELLKVEKITENGRVDITYNVNSYKGNKASKGNLFTGLFFLDFFRFTGFSVYSEEASSQEASTKTILTLEITKEFSPNAYFLLNVDGQDYKKGYTELFSEIKTGSLDVDVTQIGDLENGKHDAILSLIDNETLVGLTSGEIVINNKDKKEEPKDEKNITESLEEEKLTIEIDGPVKEVDVTFEIPGPVAYEKNLSENRKEVIVSSDYGFVNVTAYTKLPKEVPNNQIRVYWVNENRLKIGNLTYYDYDNDSLIDEVEWIVPHLSNQTFEVSIEILNVQSYPMVGGTWIVRFETSEIGNLTIEGSNGTTYGEVNSDNEGTANDLIPLTLKCGNETLFDKENLIASENIKINASGNLVDFSSTLGFSYNFDSLTANDYSCNSTGEWTVKVLTQGKHTQKFTLNDEIVYAYNDAQSCDAPTDGPWNITSIVLM